MRLVLYKSDRVAGIAKLIQSSKLITDKSDYWIDTYIWSNTHLKKALELVPTRFKTRGKDSWNPELRAYIEHCDKDFKEYEIDTRIGYIFYKGKEVRTVESCGYPTEHQFYYQLGGLQ